MKRTQTTCCISSSLIGPISTIALLLLASGASAQNVFMTDYQNGNIYEYSGGVQSIFYSGLENPSGIAFDRFGDLFATDEGRGSIYEFINHDGTLSTTPILFASGFDTPSAIAFDSAGNLFVTSANDIIEITSGHTHMRRTFATGLSSPWGLAFNRDDVLFVTDEGNNTISAIGRDGIPVTFISNGLSQPGIGLTFNRRGDLFVGNLNGYAPDAGSITKITPDRMETTFASGFGDPNAMAFDSAGDLFVTSARTPNLFEFGPDGTLLQTISISGANDLNGLAIPDDHPDHDRTGDVGRFGDGQRDAY